MRNKSTIALLLLALPAAVVAQDDGKYRCTQGDLVRRVEIFTEPGMPVPCEVHYFKDTEAPGESQVLWSAQNQADYCRAMAAEFIDRLEGWGWDCGQDTAPMPAEDDAMPEPAEGDGMDDEPVRDDTDVLSPGTTDGS